MYLNLRLNEEKDDDIIKDIGRFTNNETFTRSDRVKELIRLGQLLEQRNVTVSMQTGRAIEQKNVTHDPPRPFERKTKGPSKPFTPQKKWSLF